MLTLREHLRSPPDIGRDRVVRLLVFCVVLCLCVLLVFGLCLVCPILPASLDCPFILIASSSFSIFYLCHLKTKINTIMLTTLDE